MADHVQENIRRCEQGAARCRDMAARKPWAKGFYERGAGRWDEMAACWRVYERTGTEIPDNLKPRRA